MSILQDKKKASPVVHNKGRAAAQKVQKATIKKANVVLVKEVRQKTVQKNDEFCPFC